MNEAPNQDELCHNWLKLVEEQVASLRFGVVQITVHDSQVVQIERTEKVRLEAIAAARRKQRP